MTKTETKSWSELNNGDLNVVIDHNDALILPYEGKKVDIGTLNVVTTQVIRKDSIKTLKMFLKNQYEATKAQQDKLLEEQKNLADINEEMIPDEAKEILVKARLSVKSKSLGKELKNLDRWFARLNKKKQVKTQLDFIKGQIDKMEEEQKELDKYA